MRSKLRSARDLQRQRAALASDEPPPFPTTLPGIDHLLSGGVPRGDLVELVGRRSSGRFTIVLALLSATTGIGETAALVDLGDHLSPAAAQDFGVDLERLLWLRPRSVKDALSSSEMLLSSGFPLVVLDLGNPPLPGGRASDSFWLRLGRTARARRSGLLVSTPYRISGPAACTVLRAGRACPRWAGRGDSPRLLTGYDGRLQLDKARSDTGLEGAIGALPLTTPQGPPIFPPGGDVDAPSRGPLRKGIASDSTAAPGSRAAAFEPDRLAG